MRIFLKKVWHSKPLKPIRNYIEWLSPHIKPLPNTPEIQNELRLLTFSEVKKRFSFVFRTYILSFKDPHRAGYLIQKALDKKELRMLTFKYGKQSDEVKQFIEHSSLSLKSLLKQSEINTAQESKQILNNNTTILKKLAQLLKEGIVSFSSGYHQGKISEEQSIKNNQSNWIEDKFFSFFDMSNQNDVEAHRKNSKKN